MSSQSEMQAYRLSINRRDPRTQLTRRLQTSIIPKNQPSDVSPVQSTLFEKRQVTTPSIGRVLNYDELAQGHGIWHRMVDEYRKNYCPRRSPYPVLPTSPTDKEKYSYVNMGRPFLVTCATFALLSLGVGAWQFARTSPIYSWYALYIFISQFYLFTSLYITVVGKEFDVEEHQKLLDAFAVSKETAPTVDIYLPVCHEPLEIIQNTWNYVAALKYPEKKKSVFVLDDGANSAVQSLAQRYNFNYICRPDRPHLRKAGNLRHAFAQTSSDFFTILDADFCPRPDFLLETMPYYLADPKLGILQTTQFFRTTSHQTWIEHGAGAVLEYIFRILQPCRDKWGAAICTGTNAVYRRAAVEPICGVVPASDSEDIHTGVYVTTHGWTLKNVPLNLACGVCPDTPRALFSQQLRWCTGSMSLLFSLDLWKSSLSVKQKLCYLIGFAYYITMAVQPFVGPIPAPLVLLSHPELFKYYNLFFAFPSLLLTLVAMPIWARSRYTLPAQYVQYIMSYAYLQSILDVVAGTRSSWIPSGAKTSGTGYKNHRYRNMRILAWAWTIANNTVFLAAGAYRVVGGMAWYNLMPVMMINAFNLLCMHRFLLYRHAKD